MSGRSVQALRTLLVAQSAWSRKETIGFVLRTCPNPLDRRGPLAPYTTSKLGALSQRPDRSIKGLATIPAKMDNSPVAVGPGTVLASAIHVGG